jgi:uncharacterized membrane protein (UPF0127 family)
MMDRARIDIAGHNGRAMGTCELAESALERMRGLLGRTGLDAGSGLLLQPAWSVHTAFMRFPIDAVFLDRELRVLAIAPRLRPWRAAARLGAHAVLELQAGTCERLALERGERLALTTLPAATR